MKKSQSGFTLIELVVVIVLLGILGVTALGRFQDLSADAATSANSGIAAEITSAAAINYAEAIVTGTATVAVTATENTAGNDCVTGTFGGLFQSAAFPAGYTFLESDSAGAAGNANHSCTAAGDILYCSIQRTAAPQGTLAVAALVCTGA